MTHPSSTLAVLEGMAERLKLRYGCLDSVGIAGSTSRLSQTFSAAISPAAILPTPQIALDAEPIITGGRTQVQQQQRVAAASALGNHQGKSVASISGGALPRTEADGPPKSGTHVDPVPFQISNNADRRQLVAQVMRDFGYAFGGARTHTSEARQEIPAAVSQPRHLTTTRTGPPGSTGGGAPSADPCCDGIASSLLSVAEPASRIQGSTTADILSANSNEHSDVVAGGMVEGRDDDLPRPRTPPRSHHPHPHPAAGFAQSGPNVLTVGGFDDMENNNISLSQAMRSSGQIENGGGGRGTFGATKEQSGQHDRSAERQTVALVDDIGSSIFSSQAISDLLATSRVGLNAAKREELFSLARVAYESIIGPKDQVSPVYRAYGNVARAADKVAGKSIKSINEIFSRIVSHTADRHRRGELVANERVLHHPLVVPGGCSSIAAEVVSKRGMRTNLLRVIPASAAAARAESAQRRSGRSRSARLPSPPRWPHRVVTMPFVADNLTTSQKRVRHASATRRTDSSQPVGLRSTSRTYPRKSPA